MQLICMIISLKTGWRSLVVKCWMGAVVVSHYCIFLLIWSHYSDPFSLRCCRLQQDVFLVLTLASSVCSVCEYCRKQMSLPLLMADNQIETSCGGGPNSISPDQKGSTSLFLDLTPWPFGPRGHTQAPVPFSRSMFIVHLSTRSHICIWPPEVLQLWLYFLFFFFFFNCVVVTIIQRSNSGPLKSGCDAATVKATLVTTDNQNPTQMWLPPSGWQQL